MISLLSRRFSTSSIIMATRTERMKQVLESNLGVTHLELINESHQHNVPKNSETHFKVIIVTSQFEDLPLIKRHRKVQELLADELNSGLHALSIIAKTPSEWTKTNNVDPSPKCLGGFGK